MTTRTPDSDATRWGSVAPAFSRSQGEPSAIAGRGGLVTDSANALSRQPRPHQHVLDRVCVPLRAMRLPRVAGSVSVTAKDVHSMRNRLQVRRVHAGPHATEMIDLQPRRDRADEQPIADPMREPLVSEPAVTESVDRTAPEPAARCGFWLDVMPKDQPGPSHYDPCTYGHDAQYGHHFSEQNHASLSAGRNFPALTASIAVSRRRTITRRVAGVRVE